MKNNNCTLSVVVDNEIYEQLNKICEDEERNISSLLRLIIKNYLKGRNNG